MPRLNAHSNPPPSSRPDVESVSRWALQPQPPTCACAAVQTGWFVCVAYTPVLSMCMCVGCVKTEAVRTRSVQLSQSALYQRCRFAVASCSGLPLYWLHIDMTSHSGFQCTQRQRVKRKQVVFTDLSASHYISTGTIPILLSSRLFRHHPSQ